MIGINIRHARWFDFVYKVGVGIKGVDGLIELILGILLCISPQLSHGMLQYLEIGLHEHHGWFFQIAQHATRQLDSELTGGILLFVILFLLTHGSIKLALVYCLLKKIVWAYPYAIAILSILFIVQVVPLVHHVGSVQLWLLTILDALIIYLVVGEYLDMRETPGHQDSASR